MTLLISFVALADLSWDFCSFIFSFIDIVPFPPFCFTPAVEVAAALHLGAVDLLVDGVALQQLFMGVKTKYKGGYLCFKTLSDKYNFHVIFSVARYAPSTMMTNAAGKKPPGSSPKMRKENSTPINGAIP